MAADLVLNELSLRPLAGSIAEARLRMAGLIDTLRAAGQRGASRALRMDGPLDEAELSPGYMVCQWRNDRDVDLEQRRYYRTLATKHPYLAPEEAHARDRASGADCSFAGTPAKGLLHAYMLDGLAVSLLSDDCWDATHLAVEVSELGADAQITREAVRVPHASRAVHAAAHSDWLAVRLRPLAADGREVWDERETLYPKARFCESVGAQLRAIRSKDPHLPRVQSLLAELDDYCAGWASGSFDPDALPCRARPESDATLNRYGTDRTFTCPDGKRRTFSWHVSVPPDAWRLYFWPDDTARRVVIGYVGPHLPTVDFPS